MHRWMLDLKPRSKTVRVCVSLPSNLVRQGRRFARSHNRSFSAYVALLLEGDLSGREQIHDFRNRLGRLALEKGQGSSA